MPSSTALVYIVDLTSIGMKRRGRNYCPSVTPSSTALVHIVDLTSIVDLICVCWNVTYTEELLLSCYLVAGASTSLFVDLSGPPWHHSHRLDSRILCGFYLCVLATSAPCLQHHVIVSTAEKVSPTSLLPARSVAVSASADEHSLCPHCQGYPPAYP